MTNQKNKNKRVNKKILKAPSQSKIKFNFKIHTGFGIPRWEI